MKSDKVMKQEVQYYVILGPVSQSVSQLVGWLVGWSDG